MTMMQCKILKSIDDENEIFLKNYVPVVHDDVNFNPVHIRDQISSDDIETYNFEGHQFERLRALLANHLSIMHQKGLLRSQIKQFNLTPKEVFQMLVTLLTLNLYVFI